jgi:hypothetical protein
MRVGRLVRSSLKAGSVSFSVPLSAKGKAALRHRRRLAPPVKITLTPLHGRGRDGHPRRRRARLM